AQPPRPAPAPSPAHLPDPAPGLKPFVLDTNGLLHSPNALFVFQEHEVIIPFAVIEELDKLKRQNDDIGRNARETIRHLDRLRLRGRLIEGVPWGAPSGGGNGSANGDAAAASPSTAAGAGGAKRSGKTGVVRIDVGEHVRPAAIREDTSDNRIIAVA